MGSYILKQDNIKDQAGYFLLKVRIHTTCVKVYKTYVCFSFAAINTWTLSATATIGVSLSAFKNRTFLFVSI